MCCKKDEERLILLLFLEKTKGKYRGSETFPYLCRQKSCNMEEKMLKVVLMAEAFDFIKEQPQRVGEKIFDNIHRIEAGERNAQLFKKLEGTKIWEFRTLYNKMVYRLFAFWDTEKETLVIATHGIVKKTQKTPTKEIAKAESIRQIYFNEKGGLS